MKDLITERIKQDLSPICNNPLKEPIQQVKYRGHTNLSLC